MVMEFFCPTCGKKEQVVLLERIKEEIRGYCYTCKCFFTFLAPSPEPEKTR
jgi:hypothetical protein